MKALQQEALAILPDTSNRLIISLGINMNNHEFTHAANVLRQKDADFSWTKKAQVLQSILSIAIHNIDQLFIYMWTSHLYKDSQFPRTKTFTKNKRRFQAKKFNCNKYQLEIIPRHEYKQQNNLQLHSAWNYSINTRSSKNLYHNID